MILTHVGVAGAGTMGHGIAHVSALAGYEVLVFDTTLELAQAGLQKIASNLEVGVQKNKLTGEQKAQALSRLKAVDSLCAFAPCQLVIEAAPEKLALKQSIFSTLSAVVGADAVLASNTSSLSVTTIAQAATNPARVVGLHFFNPVHLMKLLEVVRAQQTSEQTLALVRGYGERIGKQLIYVKDSPGFASSRLGVALGLEAARMLEEGVASAEDIDRAMELGYGHPMGPLKLGDLVGLDVRLAIAQYLFAETGSPTFRVPRLLERMVAEGKLGKKSGQGFYKY